MMNEETGNLITAIVVLVTAMGMYAENQQRLQQGYGIAYDKDAFDCLIADHKLSGY